MSGKQCILGILAAAGAVSLLVWVLSRPKEQEPSYKGRTLTEWLTSYQEHRSEISSLAHEATNAVHHIGRKALPLLVQWLNYEPEEWRKKLGDAVGEPAVAVGGAPVLRALAGQRAVHAGVALTAFEILGPEATSAVPALVSLLGDWQSASRCGGVLYALMFIGEAGLPPLIATVTNTSVPIALRCNAAQRIGAPIMNLGTNADWAVPILLTCLDNTDFGAEVAGTLGNLGRRPELVLPALQKCLRDGDLMMRVKAAEALGHFGKEAIAAVPDLLAVTGRHDALATEATNALLKIAPEALK